MKGRLIAYTSDVGESFRPVVPRSIVRLAYGVTWAYVGVDVAYNTAEEHLRGSSPITVLRTAVHAATFQSIASVLVPSVVIHQVRSGAACDRGEREHPSVAGVDTAMVPWCGLVAGRVIPCCRVAQCSRI